MPDDKPKLVKPINYSLVNIKTGTSVDHMFLFPRDAGVLSKVFVKHKIPLQFVIEP